MARPKFRLSAKNKKTKEYTDLGAIWEGKLAGSYNLKIKEDLTAAQVGKILTSDEYYINMFENKNSNNTPTQEDF